MTEFYSWLHVSTLGSLYYFMLNMLSYVCYLQQLKQSSADRGEGDEGEIGHAGAYTETHSL